jgi:hypothetical protein
MAQNLAPHLSMFPPDLYPPPVIPFGGTFPAGVMPVAAAATVPPISQYGGYGIAPQIFPQPYPLPPHEQAPLPIVASGLTAPAMPQVARATSASALPVPGVFYPPAAPAFIPQQAPPLAAAPRLNAAPTPAEASVALPTPQAGRGQSWSAGTGPVTAAVVGGAPAFPAPAPGLPLAPSVMPQQVNIAISIVSFSILDAIAPVILGGWESTCTVV